MILFPWKCFFIHPFDGSSKPRFRTCCARKKEVFLDKKIKYDGAVDVNECFELMNSINSLYTFASDMSYIPLVFLLCSYFELLLSFCCCCLLCNHLSNWTRVIEHIWTLRLRFVHCRKFTFCWNYAHPLIFR